MVSVVFFSRLDGQCQRIFFGWKRAGGVGREGTRRIVRFVEINVRIALSLRSRGVEKTAAAVRAMLVGQITKHEMRTLFGADSVEAVLFAADGEDKFTGRFLLIGTAVDVGNAQFFSNRRNEFCLYPPILTDGECFDTLKPFQVRPFQIAQTNGVFVAPLYDDRIDSVLV
jgi:hypothetical protein